MASEIIKKTSVSQEQILANIQEYLKTLPNYNDIKTTLDASTLQTIFQLIAGAGTWSLYNYNMLRLETYMSTATKDPSIYNLAKQWGYNINRASSPAVLMKYTGAKTITVRSGDQVATFKDKKIIYFGPTKITEAGDTLTCYTGEFKTVSKIVQYDTDGTISQKLEPETLSAIDNTLIQVFTKAKQYEISKSIEDYIVFGRISDFSFSREATTLFISDKEYNYGASDMAEGDTLTINWLETDGYDPSIVTTKIQGVTEDWIPMSILSEGAVAEGREKIRKLTPYYYSTLRRAVTEADLTYIAKAHNLIRDAFAVTEKGIPGVWEIPLSGSVQKEHRYTVALNGNVSYSYVAKDGDNENTVLKELCTKIIQGQWANATSEGNKITITNKNAKVSMSPVGSSNLFGETVEITKQETPPCCTISLYYIKHNQSRTGDILSLTDPEKLEYGKHLQTYKMAGTTIILAPAKMVTKQIKLKIELDNKDAKTDNDESVVDTVLTKINELLETQYELQLNTGFVYSEMLAAVTKITVTMNGADVQPIKSIAANQSTFDFEPSKDSYLVFVNTEIDFS